MGERKFTNQDSAMQKVTTMLWFDTQAEEAVTFYASVFPNSSVGTMIRYNEAGAKAAGRPKGSVMTATFTIEGRDFVALNGGPHFKFSEATSFVINCETQDEVDHYWSKLSQGGDVQAQQCGWLKDRFGVSWQVVPAALPTLLGDKDAAKARRVMEAMLKMKKIVITDLQRAYDSA